LNFDCDKEIKNNNNNNSHLVVIISLLKEAVFAEFSKFTTCILSDIMTPRVP